MKLFRVKTLGLLGLGFLAGSRAGKAPWDKVQGTVGQVKSKIAERGDGPSPTTSSLGNGACATTAGTQTTQFTEI